MKKSGFQVRISAFIEAGRSVDEMLVGATAMRKAVVALFDLGFTDVELHNKYMLSREVPDAPKAETDIQAFIVPPGISCTTTTDGNPATSTSYRADQMPKGTIITPTIEQPPDPPGKFDRRSA